MKLLIVTLLSVILSISCSEKPVAVQIDVEIPQFQNVDITEQRKSDIISLGKEIKEIDTKEVLNRFDSKEERVKFLKSFKDLKNEYNQLSQIISENKGNEQIDLQHDRVKVIWDYLLKAYRL